MKLSVIVPVYNAKEHLRECVDSILAQTFKNFELILVDDGSTDESAQICDKYAESDSRICVIHQTNGGVSIARNNGIKKANGDYLTFVDADDTISSDMYSLMCSQAEQTGADLVICGYRELFKLKSHDVLFNLPDCVMDRCTVINRILYSDFTGEYIINSPWNKLYKKEIIIKNKIIFPKRRRGEDWLFNISYLEVCNSAVYVNVPLYNYKRNEKSAMFQSFPEQYGLWVENRNVRRSIIEKYHFNVDWKLINSHWLTNVISYCIKTSHNKKNSVITILSDNEFVTACKLSYRLSGIRLEIIRQVVILKYIRCAYLLCHLF